MSIQLDMTVQRIAKGQDSAEPMSVLWGDHYPNALPMMSIAYHWSERKQEFSTIDVYTVEEFPCAGEFRGRGFRCVKVGRYAKGKHEAVTGAEPTDTYIDDDAQRHLCDCRGFGHHNRCKHVDALRWLVESGTIPHPHDHAYDGVEVTEEAPF